MKRSLIAIAMAVVALFTYISASAATYTVSQVPNVHVADRTQFVANPDGILSLAAVEQINATFGNLRRTTSVEPMVVMLDDIDPADIDQFATELFTEWRMGKSDVDNGLLILVVKDLRKVVFRTGYGIEGALPDITCGRIIRNIIVPAFREDDYDRGMVQAVALTSEILSDPDLAAEYASGNADVDQSSADSPDGFQVYLTFSSLAAAIMLLLLLMRLAALRGRSDYDKYRSLSSWRAPMLIITFAGLGIPLVASLPLLLLLNHWRNHSRKCSNCGGRMVKVDEVNDNKFLTPSQDLEEQIGSVDYDVWLCSDCGETDIFAYANSSSPMVECDNCHARTARLKVDRILRKPTATYKGIGEKEYECLNCHHTTRRRYDIDPDTSGAAAALGAAAILGGGRGGNSFGGGSFGGGFGGGMTGGGGASGSW